MQQRTLSSFTLSAVLFATLLTGCKKNETDYLSRVKNYPAITLNGNSFTSINIGEAFADPGVTALLDGKTVISQVIGGVDNSRIGFNFITYRAANTEGDTVQTSRIIAVVPASVNGFDQSGTFARASNGQTVRVTRLSKGFYMTDNFGGVIPPSIAIQSAYFIQDSPTSLLFPTQTVPGGLGVVKFNNLTTVFNGAGLVTRFAYAVENPTFGPATRTFNRQ